MAAEWKGDPDVIGALEGLHEGFEAFFLWAHNVEHNFGHLGYGKPDEWFDRRVDDARDLRRGVLDRLLQLGGKLEGMVDDPLEAYEEALERLQDLHARCRQAYDAADEADDYPTVKLLTANQGRLETLIEKLRGKIAWAAAIGPELFKAKQR